MDAWNPDQLKRMQAGGNGNLNNFLAQYGVSKHTDIKEKYNSKAAEFYRDKIRAAVDGRPYTPPPPSAVPASLPRPKSFAGSRSNAPDWDDWGAEPSPGRPTHSASSMALHGSSGGGDGGNSEYSLAQLNASASAKEDFFSRKIAENASRPEGLAPNQGGKYVGFGSTPALAPRRSSQGPANVEDVTEMISRGLSGLGTIAGQAATVAKEKAVILNHSLREAGVTDTLGQTANVAAEKTKEYGTKGWSLLKNAYAAAASTIEQTAAQQGFKVDLGSRNVADSNRMASGAGSYSRIGAGPPPAFDDEDEGWGASGGSSFQRNESQSHRQSYQQGGGGQGPPHRSESAYQGRNNEEWGTDNWGSNVGESAPAPGGARSSHATGNGGGGGGAGQGGAWIGWDDSQSPTAGGGGNVVSGAGGGGGAKNDDDWGKW